MTVREATAADVEACLDVLEIVAAEGIWLGTQAPIDRDERRERFLAEIGDDRAVSLVAVDADSGRVVGHLGLRVAPYGVADFGMFIAPDYRHKGAGRALVTEAVEAARRLGAHKVALQVWPHNGAARRLYRQVGFVDEGRLRRHYPRRNGEVWDAIVMGLVLDEERPGSSLPDDA